CGSLRAQHSPAPAHYAAAPSSRLASRRAPHRRIRALAASLAVLASRSKSLGSLLAAAATLDPIRDLIALQTAATAARTAAAIAIAADSAPPAGGASPPPRVAAALAASAARASTSACDSLPVRAAPDVRRAP